MTLRAPAVGPVARRGGLCPECWGKTGRRSSDARVVRRFRVGVATLLIATAASFACPGAARAQAGADVDELAWLAGSWALEQNGSRLEEVWSAPSGNSMGGHFRWIRGGELWMTELLSITEEPGGVVFRLRHFSAEMTSWEEKDDPLTYRLTERAERRATFTRTEPRTGRPTRFVFAALAGDSLLVRLEAEEEGQPSAQEFRYGRVR